MTPEKQSGSKTACDGDSCPVSYTGELDREQEEKLRYMLRGLEGAQLKKLKHWLGMEPIDLSDGPQARPEGRASGMPELMQSYDAPGTTVRETGV